MSSALAFLPAPDEKPLGTWRATIASTPVSTAEPVMVTIPAYTADLQWGPCRWMPRTENQDFVVGVDSPDSFTAAVVILPQRGDQALVSFDENDEPWVVSYGFPE